MPPTVSAIVTAARFGGALVRTIEAVEGQTFRPIEIKVIAPASDPRVGDWWQALGRRVNLRVVPLADEPGGAARNRAVRESQGTFVFHLDAGDWIAPRFVERAVEALVERSEHSFVTSWWTRVGGEASGVVVPAGCDVASLVGNCHAVHPATVFRRLMWDELGGLDETLEALEDYDFWLRAVESGWRGWILAEELFRCGSTADSVRHATLGGELGVSALGRVIEKHRELFDAHAADALCCRERTLLELARERAELDERRLALVAESERLAAEVVQLRERLAAFGQTGIDFGELRRTTPFSDDWGFDRGMPIDRRYIERFLETNAADIRGEVLEVKGTDYTMRFGAGRVTRADAVDLEGSNAVATKVVDLRTAWNIPDGRYDCVVLTQTIHLIDDMPSVVSHLHRALKPGGVLLATLPSVSRVEGVPGTDGDFWRVTEAGARRIFQECFGPGNVSSTAYGNVLTAAAFLYGLASHELTDAEFDANDPRIQVLVGIRAVKPIEEGRSPARTRAQRERQPRALILGYHRVADPGPSDIHELCTSPDRFWKQLAHLKAHYDVVPLSTVVSGLQEESVPDGAVAITLDDGYLDALTGAAPILLELNLPATFFVTTAPLVHAEPFWWDALEDVWLGEAAQAGTLPAVVEVDTPLGVQRYATGSSDDRLAAHWGLYRILIDLSASDRHRVIAELRRAASWTPRARFPRPLTVQELKVLSEFPGMTVGAHGVAHLNLPSRPLPDLQTDLRASRVDLASALGQPVKLMAYPFGAWSETTASAACAEGFQAAVTTEPGSVTNESHSFALPRLTVGAWDVTRLASEAALLLPPT